MYNYIEEKTGFILQLVKAYDPSAKMSRREAAKMKKALLTEKQNLKNLTKEEITKYVHDILYHHI
jgi:hypothetical protein